MFRLLRFNSNFLSYHTLPFTYNLLFLKIQKVFYLLILLLFQLQESSIRWQIPFSRFWITIFVTNLSPLTHCYLIICNKTVNGFNFGTLRFLVKNRNDVFIRPLIRPWIFCLRNSYSIFKIILHYRNLTFLVPETKSKRRKIIFVILVLVKREFGLKYPLKYPKESNFF